MVQQAVPINEVAGAPSTSAPDRPHTKLSPLHEAHVAFGGHFTDYAGIWIPQRYEGEVTEAKAVRETAGLFDMSYAGEMCVLGRDAGALLDYALIGDVLSMPIGRARYMMMCHEDGGILEDMVVCRLDTAEYLVISNTVNVQPLMDELVERGRGFAASVYDRTDDYAVIAVDGPRASDILVGLTPVQHEQLRYYQTVETALAGRDGVLARTGFTGEDCFEFYCAPDDANDVWYAIAEAGEAFGLHPAGLASRDLLRLEAGITCYGRELTRDVTPYEAGLGMLVKPGRANFVGKAALAERAAASPTIALTGLVGTGHRLARSGHAVIDRTDGRRVGTVTSGGPSPTLGRPIAMAYLEVGSLGSTELAVEIRGELESFEITTLPFYSRSL
jgi:aminomethyltransferase